MEAEVCPNCTSEDTYQMQDWLGKELRFCENCEREYQVSYKIEIKEKKLK
jgi:transposase-like protein